MLLASDDSGRALAASVTPPNCSYTNCSLGVMTPLPTSVDMECDDGVGVSVAADDAADDGVCSLRCDRSGDCEREGERERERERDTDRCWMR